MSTEQHARAVRRHFSDPVAKDGGYVIIEDDDHYGYEHSIVLPSYSAALEHREEMIRQRIDDEAWYGDPTQD